VGAWINGLIPNTTYYFSCGATNADGGVVGGILNFTTTAVPPSATTQAATAVAATTATLNGTVSDNGLAGYGGGNSTYNFNYGTVPTLSPSTGTTWTSFSGTSAESASLTGLTSGTTYYFNVAAWNGDGTTYGSTLSFTTNSPPSTNLSSPASGTYVNAVTGGETFAWTYVNNGASGAQLDYSLAVTVPSGTTYYWTGSAWTTTQSWVTSSAGSVTISAANWNTLPTTVGTFTWSVATQDANGKGGYATAWTLISEGPPNAPTLGVPAPGTYADLAGTPTFSWTYNPSNAIGGQLYWAMRRRTGGGSYVYWNSGTPGWQSSIYWNSGAGQSYTFPAASWTDGNTYSWSVATADAGGGENTSSYPGGPTFAADFSVVAQTAPTVSVTEPTGTVSVQLPVVQWSVTPASGAAQIAWQVRTFTAAQYGAGGFNPATSAAVDDSGVVSNANTSYQIATTLPISTTFRSYVNSTETGSESNNFNAYGGYTVSLDLPPAPTLTATATQDTTSLPGDGAMSGQYLPMIQLVAQANLNMLSAVDSSFESGVGSFVGTVCTLSQSATKYLDGAYSLKMVANSTTGTMSAASTYYACQPSTQYSAIASMIAAATARNFTVGLHWFTSSDASISTSTGTPVADNTSSWTQASVTATSPSNAAYFEVVLTVASVANAEIHYADEVGVFLGSGTTWGLGGLLGSAAIVILRSDGVYVRHASTANPASLSQTTQSVTVNDYEVVPGITYTYQALVQATEGTNTVQSAYSSAAVGQIAAGLGFWEFDPLNPAPSACAAQPTNWNPSQIIQSAAHTVLGQTTMNLVQYAVQQPDFNATFATYSTATYNAIKALTLSQHTVFVSHPFGEGPYYFSLGPQPGGGSGGSGNTAHSTQLYPSVAGAPVRDVAVTAIAAPRPPT
jgi:hypothetical protein